MSLANIVNSATNKQNFLSISDYIGFCKTYLTFVASGLQAVIVSQNENHYRFYQYKEDAHFNITRPINSNLMYGFDELARIEKEFPKVLASARDLPREARLKPPQWIVELCRCSE